MRLCFDDGLGIVYALRTLKASRQNEDMVLCQRT